MTDPGAQLRSLLMLGNWVEQRAALDRAVAAVPKDETQWTDTGIGTRMWMHRVGEQLTGAIPQIIQESGKRPAHAVTELIRTALALGIEIGRQLERQENHHDR